MSAYLIRRIVQLAPLLLLVTFLAYGIMHAAPGGPETILLGGEDPNITAADVARLRAEWGLDQPWYVQYLKWLWHALQGNLGKSYYNHAPVVQVIAAQLPATLKLNAAVLLLSYLVAIPLGIITAVRQHSAMDYAASIGAFIGQSLPSFWVGLMLIYLVALPFHGKTSGMMTPGLELATHGLWAVMVDRVQYMLLPLLTLTAGSLAYLARYTRNAMLDVLKEDCIRTARAKGLAERVVTYRHAFRNALLPLVTLSGGLLAALVSGAVITEQVFAWPGVGFLSIRAVYQRDYPLVMAFLLTGAALTMLGNLLVDIVYVWVDPRIRYQ